jgi:hypothetical protein
MAPSKTMFFTIHIQFVILLCLYLLFFRSKLNIQGLFTLQTEINHKVIVCFHYFFCHILWNKPIELGA